YLKASGGQRHIRAAIYSYNHAGWYVDSVLMRSRLIAGLPADLIGSLTGLTEGRFPVQAPARYTDRSLTDHRPGRRSGSTAVHIDIDTRAGARVIAVQDGEITTVGYRPGLGHFLNLQDQFGNTYTYGHLASGHTVVVARASRRSTRRAIRSPQHLRR